MKPAFSSQIVQLVCVPVKTDVDVLLDGALQSIV